MTIEEDILREQLLALISSLQLDLPDYSADPIVLRRVGKVLSETSAGGCLQLLTNKNNRSMV